MGLLRGVMPGLNALVDKSLGQRVGDICRDLWVTRVAYNSNYAARARGHDRDVLFHHVGNIVNVQRCQTWTGEPPELIPEVRGTLEFRPRIQVEFLDNLFNQRALLQNF